MDEGDRRCPLVLSGCSRFSLKIFTRSSFRPMCFAMGGTASVSTPTPACWAMAAPSRPPGTAERPRPSDRSAPTDLRVPQPPSADERCIQSARVRCDRQMDGGAQEGVPSSHLLKAVTASLAQHSPGRPVPSCLAQLSPVYCISSSSAVARSTSVSCSSSLAVQDRSSRIQGNSPVRQSTVESSKTA
ncbi:hypothetical protein DPEC_G00124110 [Dallia pectoralis]|uniref:Uncharacterized protein n=1 Tax=Dallia pectoralis TaxID=75939 RepID=A0ACC2GR55_DALPE|nr:hypothetical protein DPEC_G00124110 [Dallia pectoralis]